MEKSRIYKIGLGLAALVLIAAAAAFIVGRRAEQADKTGEATRGKGVVPEAAAPFVPPKTTFFSGTVIKVEKNLIVARPEQAVNSAFQQDVLFPEKVSIKIGPQTTIKQVIPHSLPEYNRLLEEYRQKLTEQTPTGGQNAPSPPKQVEEKTISLSEVKTGMSIQANVERDIKGQSEFTAARVTVRAK